MTSRKDVEALLKKDGDFVVRSSEHKGEVNAVLSLSSGEDKIHLCIMESDKGKFYLRAVPKEHRREFSCVVDLVKHYMERSIRLKTADGTSVFYRLKEGVPRPKWLVNSELISYNPDEKPLGKGHFANVYMGTFLNTGPTGKEEKITVAIKVLKEKSKSADEKEAKESMIREAKLMSFYSHPNVVQFYGLACDRAKEVVLVMEYCRGGSLDVHLKAQKGNILVAERVTFALEAALGMRYLHSEGCIHRDLAARNCLISDQGIVKIADFGLSAVEGVIEQTITNVPLRWMAPETLLKKPQFTSKSDVWAYGVLLYEIFAEGERPWPNDDFKQIAIFIKTLEMPSMPPGTPPAVAELVATIWVRETRLRPSFCAIVARLVRIRIGELQSIDPAVSSVNRIQNVRRVAYNYDVDAVNDVDTLQLLTGDKTSGLTSGGTTSIDDDLIACGTKAMIRRPKLIGEGLDVTTPSRGASTDGGRSTLPPSSGQVHSAPRSAPTGGTTESHSSSQDFTPPSCTTAGNPAGSPAKSPGGLSPAALPLAYNPQDPAAKTPNEGSRPADPKPDPKLDSKSPRTAREKEKPSNSCSASDKKTTSPGPAKDKKTASPGTAIEKKTPSPGPAKEKKSPSSKSSPGSKPKFRRSPF